MGIRTSAPPVRAGTLGVRGAMSSRKIVLGLLGLAAAASAQSTGAVVGIVRDNVTNAPIPAANARLTGARTFVAVAGPDGRYRMDGVPEGKYKLDTYATGYVGPSAAQDLARHPFHEWIVRCRRDA
jgi:Carboxypeptidase regulatory-like domain